MSARQTVACLAGAGIAPELMAEAVLALSAVAHLHAVDVEDLHIPFGATAVAQGGQAFPQATRSAVLAADAVLVAGAEEPTLADVMAELDLRARVTRVRFGRAHDLEIVAPLSSGAAEWALEAAFGLAEQRRLQLAVVGDHTWEELAHLLEAEHEDVRVEYLSPKSAVPLAAFDAARFDVVAVSERWAEPIVEIVAAPAQARVVAHALLAEHGPSLFMPSPEGGVALAGHGVVNPSSMLLAAALLLEHGLHEPAAASTLAGAVSAALVDGPRTPDLLRRGRGASTREFTSRVLAGFQMSLRNAEFWPEAAQ
ncbi:MAG TPA: isocitrate/isopropylmalate family dehydrogenase [Gaiellaceae bacterium]|nr:isocitrate/isopropylmalate family dehydrogenase [Gaiellaceae bacterium]